MDEILHPDLDEEDVLGVGDHLANQNENSESQNKILLLGPRFGWYLPSARESNSDAKAYDENWLKSDPYDNFMRRHLQHYGYYTGRNASFRDNFRSLQEWRRNYDARLSGHHNLSIVEEQLGRSFKPGSLQHKMIEAPSVFSAEGQLPDDLLHRTTQLVFQYQAGRKIPKLREPRNLYALTKEAGPQQATRWPSHMQVVSPAIAFIDYNPPVPDPLYKLTGKESTPSVRGPHSGEMIYYNDPGRDLYFMRSRVAGCRLAMRNTLLTPCDFEESNCTLEFESRFESGNLLKVDKINDFDYELTLRTDLYTNKHTQWFFFRVRNMRPGRSYRFTIINLMKPSSLYNQGMRPVWYSEINAKKNQIGWVRMGSNIRYYRNNMTGRDGRTYYSLTWTCEFPYKDDCCYFAHCYPYTYSDLQEYLLQLANDPVRSRFCKQRVLCRTLAGNLVYILTITSPSRNPEISRAKRAVVLTARVHPGETNASWMMKGFLDYLTGNSADAKLLRDSFIFKIVPMLNPDGVIVGNYRCSLAGRDLNRNYKSVLKDSFPSIWHTKMMIKRLNAERQVVVYCDLHGHSRKNNIFIYGCENKHNPQRRLRERIFPLMLSKNALETFSYESCKYKVQKSKEGTGRIVVWYMGVMNSYTMEATFGGTSLAGERKDTHLSTKDLEKMGYHFCDTLLDYCDPDSSKVEACMRELQDKMRRQILRRLQLQNRNISDDLNLDDYISELESDTSGSDSSCDDGLPVHLLAIAPKLQRKKKLRARREKGKMTSKLLSSGQESKPPTTHSAKLPSEKSKSLRYSQASSTSSRRRDDHTRGSTTPNTCSADERGGDRSAKKSEYLDALTSAYLRSGVLMVPDQVKDYPLRYTNSSGGATQDGNFTVQYLANHLGALSAEREVESKVSSPEMRNASCQWSPQPEPSPESGSDEEDLNKEAIIAEEQYEILRQSALRRQLSAGQQRLLAQKHLIAVAAMQQRQEDKQRVSSALSGQLSSKLKKALSSQHGENEGAADPLMLVTKGSIRSNSHAPSAVSGAPNVSEVPPDRSIPSSTDVRNSDETPAREGPNAKASSPDRSKRPISGASNPLHKKQTLVPTRSKISVKAVDGVMPDIKQNNLSENTKPAISSTESIHMNLNTSKQTNEESELSVPDPLNFHKSEVDSGQNVAPNMPWHVVNDAMRKESPRDSLPGKDKKSSTLSDSLWSSRKDHPSNILETAQHFHKERKFVTDPPLTPLSVQSNDIPSNTLLTRVPRSRTINQTTMKGFVKGELALPKAQDATTIPPGIKKTTSLIVETDPDSLTVHSNRYLFKNPRADTESHGRKTQAKLFQAADDSFFGMSDRIGLSVMPRQGRVPPVVANIAELRRSLMGQGRESEKLDSKPDQPRRIISQLPSHRNNDDVINHADDVIPFSQRARRSNARPRQWGRGFTDFESNEEQPAVKRTQSFIDEQHPDSTRFERIPRDLKRTKINSGSSSFDGHFKNFNVIDELIDGGSPPPISRRSDMVVRLRHNDGVYDDDVAITSRSETANRSYTQGNATIEKRSDTSVTKIRIGSRNTEHRSRISQHAIDIKQRQETLSASGKGDKHTLSAVSLNMDPETEERNCVSTPALASRPVPPLLRYLSAKQGQNKKR
ncbi:uncharacterized protein LOC143464813 isoform X3 [Clavelina lepadiformis]|uniref:uncharacterized protein LOC143464813 isoform X3 n=1 Tax=Clavelina lepadiformis TaxID=159417 RepID=UPI0040419751